MTYCGAIGSVNVLEFMSTELFDESQENPFLLKAPVHDAVAAAAMGASSSPQRRHSLVSAKCAFELPLHDPQQQEASDYHHQHGYMNASSPTKVYHHQPQQQPQQYHQHQQHDLYYQSAPTSPVPAPPSSPSGRASVTFNLPKSILKRQSSYDSDSSTVPPSETDYVGVDVSETELHKLLYSLARFSVASEASVADNMSPSPSPQPQRQYSISQPMSPNATLNSTSPWLKGSNAPPPSPMSSPSKAGYTTQDRTKPRSPSSSVKKSKARSKSADRGYETDPETFATSDEYESEDDGRGRMAHSRGSVSFETVKNLLRGGGSGARASRIVKRSIPDLRRKSMGTVSSRLKRRQKFARPTILTDAYHRVSTMKLGTKPMPVKVKHLAFPEPSEIATLEVEHDPDMPSPRGQLRHNSLVLLETLDKIGTRAACPVHLIDVEMPDYSNVPARVDSYNHMLKPKQGLRRPSAWLLGNAAAMVSFQAPPQCYDSD